MNIIVGDALEKSGSTFAVETAKCLQENNHILPSVVYGFLRAVAECPNCPGVFRVPLGDDGDWNLIGCPNCKEVWRRSNE